MGPGRKRMVKEIREVGGGIGQAPRHTTTTTIGSMSERAHSTGAREGVGRMREVVIYLALAHQFLLPLIRS